MRRYNARLRVCATGLGLWLWLLCGSFASAQVSNPVFTPPDGTRLPVTVTISNATAGATVYCTTNGTVPVTNSAIYSVPLAFTNDTVLRARAFKSGQTPSDTISATYIAWPDAPGVACQRTVTNDLPSAPLVTLKVSGASNVTCFTIEERLPAVVQATNITSGGYLTNRTVRWGPFTNTATVTVSYRATGLPGTYTVDGAVSVDGAWMFGPSPSSVTISTAGGGDVPSQLPQVAMPVFSPPSSSGVPTNVTITCATPRAAIYYTLDGSLPSTASTLYTGAVYVASASVVRARAFTNGWLPSVAGVASYGPQAPAADATVTRVVSANPPSAPLVSFTASAGTNAMCWAVEDWLPLGLSASNVTAGGVFSVSNRVVHWGPFFGTNTQVLTYQAVGQPGTYTVRATWSVDGVGGGEVVGRNVVVASATGGGGVPTPPNPLPMPVLSPASGTNLPVTVTISCADSLAEIRFTTDGSVPTGSSSLYSTALQFAAPTTLRARAFRAGYLPSVAAVGNYVAAGSGETLALVRSVSGNASYLPTISVTATPQGSLGCYSVTETVASGLTPYEIGQDAVWSETSRTLKWGPYTNTTPRVLTYKVSGPSGTYALAGLGSSDGGAVAVKGATAVTVDLNTMPVVATPVITPTPNGVFPVNVTISCATTGAVIHYTLDGSPASESSPVYAGPIRLETTAIVQARAFRPWSVASGPITVFYGDEQPATGTGLGRTVSGNGTTSPLVQISVQPGATVKCYSVSEVVPAGLSPSQISAAGVFSAATRTIRWGPFLDAQARTVSYRLSGSDGSYELSGAGSFDGFDSETPGERVVVLDNHPYLAHGVVSNWTYSVSVVVTARPPAGAWCYTVEEFLPVGVTPMNISDGGLWNSNTLTIKWGPFVDDTLRAFRYEPVGAFASYQTSAQMSVDGVSHSWAGDFTAAVGLPAPEHVLAVAGNRTVYLGWQRNGHEAGWKLYYWTLPNHADERVVNLGLPETDFYALTGLTNNVTYRLAMTAYDARGMESARSVEMLAKPMVNAGYYGQVWLDATNYLSVASVAIVRLVDADLDTNSAVAETARVWVSSDSDTNGFAVILRETGLNTGTFTSAAAGTNLSFSFVASSAAHGQLFVAEGDMIRVAYNDALPAGVRIAEAQFMQYDSDGDGIPDAWEREFFGGLTVAGPGTDFDKDGMSDFAEQIAGTDPKNSASLLQVAGLATGAEGEVLLSWPSVAGRAYAIEKSSGLGQGFFELISGLPATPPTNVRRDVSPTGGAQVYYRIRCWKQ